MPAQIKLPVSDVLQLRSQGLTDNLIADELKRRGYNQQQVTMAVSEADASSGGGFSGGFSTPNNYPSNFPAPPPGMSSGPQMSMPSSQPSMGGDDHLYERIEETVESLIDEKWDDLIAEVKKIVEWKEKMEETQNKLIAEVDNLKENFKLLHQGVLGKLEDYDKKMGDVDTELKAVGKVFKDVIPVFVDNVKELQGVTQSLKKK